MPCYCRDLVGVGVGGLLLGVLLVRLVGVTLGWVGGELICCVAPCILPWHGRLLVRYRLKTTRIKALWSDGSQT